MKEAKDRYTHSGKRMISETTKMVDHIGQLSKK